MTNFLKQFEESYQSLQVPEGETKPTFYEYARDQLRKKGIQLHYKDDEDKQTMISKYSGDKTKLNLSDPEVRNNRSVVYDLNTHETLMMSPPKSDLLEDFRKEHPDLKDVLVQEFPSGPMVNDFYHPSLEHRLLSTRSFVGAENNFRTKRTFRELFMDAFKNATGLDYNETFGSGKLENEPVLKRDWTYSYVLQHPDYLDVPRVKEPTLYLVEVRDRCNNFDRVDLDQVEKEFKEAGWKIKFPKKYQFGSWDEVDKFIETQDGHEQGLVFHYQNQRSKVRNNSFLFNRELLGNCSVTEDIFAENYKNKTINDFKSVYPEMASLFDTYVNEMEALKKEIHSSYIANRTRPVGKRIMFNEIPKVAQTACYELHGQYLNKGYKVTPEVIENYIQNMTTHDLGTLLNNWLKHVDSQLNHKKKVQELREVVSQRNDP